MFNSRRNSELDQHAEAGRLQGITGNPSSRRQQNQNSIQYYGLLPVSTEHRATYDGDAIYNYPHYPPSHSGQPSNSITGSPLHRQPAQRIIGSTTWQSPCNVYSNHPSHSFSHYMSAPGLGLSDAHLADTPPITYPHPFSHDVHYQIQAPGWLYFGHVANDSSKPYMPYPADSSPTANIQPVHHNTRCPIQSPEGPYFGRLANDRFEPYMPHPADSPIAHTQPIHYDTHRQIQSPGGPDFERVVDDGFTLYAPHPTDSPIAHTQPIRYNTHRQIQSPGGPDFGRVVDDGFTPYTPHPADTPRIAHIQPVRYDVRHQIQFPRQPYFNDEFEPDVHPADSPSITPTQLVHHGMFQRLEGPYFGPGVDDESEADTHLADFTPLTNTAHHQVQLAEVGHGDDSNSDDSPRPYTCMWQHNGYELCGRIAAEGAAQHMATFHLTRGETHYVCQWRGCRRSKPYRRDTICRHIREAHLGERR